MQLDCLSSGYSLKVILMSATMNVDEFSAYFNKAPVFFLEGRQFQVDVFHAEKPQSDYMFSAISTVLQLHRTTPLDHDILVFMTGQEEIDATVKTLNELNKSSNMQNGRAKHANNNNSAEQQQQQRQQLPMLVLPLYSALPQNKQLRVFERAPSGCRKVIISTNVAETSITIKGIKFVVDTGKIKAKLYTPQVGIEILKVYNISKSQAWQRTGRAGRESSGMVFDLALIRFTVKCEFIYGPIRIECARHVLSLVHRGRVRQVRRQYGAGDHALQSAVGGAAADGAGHSRPARVRLHEQARGRVDQRSTR